LILNLVLFEYCSCSSYLFSRLLTLFFIELIWSFCFLFWISWRIYHMLRDQITMGTGFNIPWIGIDKWLVGGQNTMCSGGQHTMGKWLVGVQRSLNIWYIKPSIHGILTPTHGALCMV
jgi:hypothetical protein